MIGERHSFRGYADTLLSWDEMNSQWRIQLYSDPSVYATLRSFEYPFGTADWEVFGDDCSDLSMQIVSLNINACSDGEFNCVDGSCVDIFSRCDGKTDCPDKTGTFYLEFPIVYL